MNALLSFLYRIGVNDIFGLLSLIGLTVYLIRRFLLRRSPVPKSSFKTVPRELLDRCVALLQKEERRIYEPYFAPEEILALLRDNCKDPECLKRLLCDICAHIGIDGSFIKLIVDDRPVPDKAGEISTDLAFTTIRLEMSCYTLDTVIAVLAHEAIHLHLYYTGTHMRDNWENEILTDTAAVYCGFGEYLYRGYAVMRGEFAFSYHKVGYISQEDVRYIQELMSGNGVKNENWNGI